MNHPGTVETQQEQRLKTGLIKELQGSHSGGALWDKSASDSRLTVGHRDFSATREACKRVVQPFVLISLGDILTQMFSQSLDSCFAAVSLPTTF